MRVFVAGATGVLGKRAIRLLVAAGHEVTAVARTPEKAALVRAAGATPVEVDLFDPTAVKDAVAGHDVVCNLATHIPRVSRSMLPGAWDENDRIRREASRNLVDALLATGGNRFVQESITFIYADAGEAWIDEDHPVEAVATGASVAEAERQAARVTEAGRAGVVLRFALFYGPDGHTTQDLIASARRGLAATIGPADAYQSSISTDDAAAAVVAALEAPPGVYNVADDEPLTRREVAEALAVAVGRRVVRLPAAASRVGGSKTALLARSQRVSAERFKAATGWRPAYRSLREGLPATVAEMDGGGGAIGGPGRAVRIPLALLALAFLRVGVEALVFPRHFYDAFPGAGRAWVAVDGPYNEHLVRDVGALNVALAIVVATAAWRGGRLFVATASVGALVYGAPHLLYHLFRLELYGPADQVGNVVALGLGVVVPLVSLVAAARKPALLR